MKYEEYFVNTFYLIYEYQNDKAKVYATLSLIYDAIHKYSPAIKKVEIEIAYEDAIEKIQSEL